jgi:hypothetical protein
VTGRLGPHASEDHNSGYRYCVEHKIEFSASRVRAVRLVLGSLGFVGAGIWLASSSSWIGWAAIAFGGVGMVVAIVQLITVDRTILKLDPDGFAMIQWGVGQHRNKDFLSWSESFWITRLIWNKVIAVLPKGARSARRHAQADSGSWGWGVRRDHPRPVQRAA